MRPKTHLLTAVCAVIAWLAAAPEAAALNVELYGGWNRYAMGAVNDSLESLNASVGTDLGPIRAGPAWGIGLRQWAGENVLTRLEFEKVSATTEDPTVRVSLGALVWSVGATWFTPAAGRFRYGLGIGFGLYSSYGTLAGLKTSGLGYGPRGTAEVIMPMGSKWSLHGTAGYRWARIPNMKIAENETDIDADYSGAILRLGIATDGARPRPADGP